MPTSATKAWLQSMSRLELTPALRRPAHRAQPHADAAAQAQEHSHGWHDSSFDLRQGLDVIETDWDPRTATGFALAPKRR